MKLLYKISSIYAILALIGGILYREFIKFNNYTQQTSLAFLHVHLFALGMIIYLLLMLFEHKFSISQTKTFKKFNLFYNMGLIITVIMMIMRGVMEVLNISLSSGFDASISGIAGIGHILLAIGIFFLYRMLHQAIFKK